MKTKVFKVSNIIDLQGFLAVPYRIYGKEKIPPQASDFITSARFMPLLNPMLEHITYANFVAIKEGQLVGRITASVDGLNPRSQEGFFGCFECIDNLEVAGMLLDTAARWLKKQNKTSMVGPVTLNTNQQVGLLIEGFEHEMQNELPYNPPYYQNLMLNAGLVKIQDLECYKWKLPNKMPRNFIPKSRLNHVAYRPVHPGPRDAQIVRDIYNETFSEMWGFIPLTLGDAMGLLMGVGSNIPPSLFFIIEVEGQPAAIFLAIPYKKPEKNGRGGKVRLAVAGVVPKFRKRGILGHALIILYKQCLKLGYDEGEASQVAESNEDMKRIITKPLFGVELIKRYRVYQRQLI